MKSISLFLFVLTISCTAKQKNVDEHIDKQSEDQTATEEEKSPKSGEVGACLIDSSASNLDFASVLEYPSKALQEYIDSGKSNVAYGEKVKEGSIVRGIKQENGYKLSFYNLPEGSKKVSFSWLPGSESDIIDSFIVQSGQTEISPDYIYDFEDKPLISVMTYNQNTDGKYEVSGLYFQDLRTE